MNEPERRINRSVDWVYQEQCGCRTIWLGCSMHAARRFEACCTHSQGGQHKERQAILQRAIEANVRAWLNEPPW